MYYSMSFCQYYSPNIDYPEHLGPDAFSDKTVTRNTWDDWHIVPIERPAINPPSIKTEYVSIPGRNGKIDLSQSLTKYPVYDNRTGSIEFAVLNDYRNWQVAYTDIMATLHGKKMMMTYEEDPEYYYVGRWSVGSWKTGKTRSGITLNYDLEPYKWKLEDCSGAWLWDPFNFNTGIISSRIDSFTPNNRIIDTTGSGDDIHILDYSECVGPGGAGGHPEEQENYSNIIGNAPAVLSVGVYPDTNYSISLKFYNREIDSDQIVKTYTEQYSMRQEPDFVITNYTGTNAVILSATGKGRVSWNFRPGRL